MGNNITIYPGRIRKGAKTGQGSEISAGEHAYEIEDKGQLQNEAEDIISNAYREAREIIRRKEIEFEQDYESKLAQRLAETFADTHFGLDDAAGAMATIVDTSLRRIMGSSHDPENILAVIRHTITDYQDTHSLKIIVAPRDYSRLAVLLKAGEMIGEIKGVKLLQDTSFEPGRCVLDTGDRRFNISIDAQIAGLRRIIEKNGHVLEWADDGEVETDATTGTEDALSDQT